MVRLLGRCVPIFCIPKKKRQSLAIGEHGSNGTKHQEEINKLFVRRVESIRVTHQSAVVKRCMSPIKPEEQPKQQKKTKSKKTLHNGEKLIKPDDTEFDCETHISDRQSKQKSRIKSKKKPSPAEQKSNEKISPNIRTSLDKLFNRTAKPKVASPEPSKANNAPENDDHDTTSTISSSSSSMSSDWSSTTYSDSQSSEKSKDLVDPDKHRQTMPTANLTNKHHEMKHQSCVENFYLSKEHARQISSASSPLPMKPLSLNVKEDDRKNRTSQSQYSKRSEIKPSAKSKQVLQNVRKMIKDQSVQEEHFNHTRQRESVRL